MNFLEALEAFCSGDYCEFGAEDIEPYDVMVDILRDDLDQRKLALKFCLEWQAEEFKSIFEKHSYDQHDAADAIAIVLDALCCSYWEEGQYRKKVKFPEFEETYFAALKVLSYHPESTIRFSVVASLGEFSRERILSFAQEIKHWLVDPDHNVPRATRSLIKYAKIIDEIGVDVDKLDYLAHLKEWDKMRKFERPPLLCELIQELKRVWKK